MVSVFLVMPAMCLYWAVLGAIAAYGAQSAAHARRARWFHVPLLAVLCVCCCAGAVSDFAAAYRSIVHHVVTHRSGTDCPLWPGPFVLPSMWVTFFLNRKARQ